MGRERDTDWRMRWGRIGLSHNGVFCFSVFFFTRLRMLLVGPRESFGPREIGRKGEGGLHSVRSGAWHGGLSFIPRDDVLQWRRGEAPGGLDDSIESSRVRLGTTRRDGHEGQRHGLGMRIMLVYVCMYACMYVCMYMKNQGRGPTLAHTYSLAFSALGSRVARAVQ